MRYISAAEMPPRELTCAFTGHRPVGLPWRYNESDPRCVRVKQALAVQIESVYEKGARYFLSGMAEGADLYAAEAVLELKRKYPDMELIAVFPYGSGNSYRQRRAAEAAWGVISLRPDHSVGCFIARDRFMAERCAYMLCVFSGDTKSGTAATMRMALDAGAALTVLRV